MQAKALSQTIDRPYDFDFLVKFFVSGNEHTLELPEGLNTISDSLSLKTSSSIVPGQRAWRRQQL